MNMLVATPDREVGIAVSLVESDATRLERLFGGGPALPCVKATDREVSLVESIA